MMLFILRPARKWNNVKDDINNSRLIERFDCNEEWIEITNAEININELQEIREELSNSIILQSTHGIVIKSFSLIMNATGNYHINIIIGQYYIDLDSIGLTQSINNENYAAFKEKYLGAGGFNLLVYNTTEDTQSIMLDDQIKFDVVDKSNWKVKRNAEGDLVCSALVLYTDDGMPATGYHFRSIVFSKQQNKAIYLP